MLNNKSDVKRIDEIRNEISKLPEELKAELNEQGFDMNNDQHVYDFYIEILKEAKNSQGENTNQILSEAELDSISGGHEGQHRPISKKNMLEVYRKLSQTQKSRLFDVII
ncbi:hypothetical protein [Francisella hispaniensis]|uniref:hypothetical protein n=1 Tax=Francisella hispaniensis TaxID=622488 RepID=UPI001F1E5AED|nr:hypothetical protein [Francisella hispaniensis]